MFGSLLVGGGLLAAPGKAAAKTATRGVVKGAEKVVNAARRGLDNLDTLNPGNRGLVPAIPNGRLPVHIQNPTTAEGIWFKDGKARITLPVLLRPLRDQSIRPAPARGHGRGKRVLQGIGRNYLAASLQDALD